MVNDPQISINPQIPTTPLQNPPKTSFLKILGLIFITAIIAAISSIATYYTINTNAQAKLDLIGSENRNLKNQIRQQEIDKQKELEKKSQNVCVDSDGGQDHYVNGSIKNREFDSSGSVKAAGDVSDDCVNTFMGGENKDALREYYCDANNNVQYDYFVCPNGCSKGVCIK